MLNDWCNRTGWKVATVAFLVLLATSVLVIGCNTVAALDTVWEAATECTFTPGPFKPSDGGSPLSIGLWLGGCLA